MFWFGSYSVRDPKCSSDLDCALLLGAASDFTAIITDLRDTLGTECQFQAGTGCDAKACFWVGPSFVKIDVVLARSSQDLAWLADAMDVPPPRLVCVFDHDGACASLLRRAHVPAALDVTSRINQEIEKFLVGFEACSAAHHKSDAYSHYFEYNLALGRVARLVQLARSRPERLYLPVKLTSTCLSLEEQERFRSLAGTMRLADTNAAKRRLARFFMAIFRELDDRYALARAADEVQVFLDQVLARDFLWNVRDWAEWTEGWVRPGVIMRASSLTRWQNDPALEVWLGDSGVAAIVDLRSSEEASERPYHAPWLDRIAYHHVPLNDKDLRDIAMPEAFNESRGRLYADQARASIVQAVTIYRILAMARGATVVHCHIGVDRTGWVLALLGLAIGIPISVLADDYLASEMHTIEGTIEAFAQALGGPARARQLLIDAGLNADDFVELRRKILAGRPRDASADLAMCDGRDD